MDNQIKSRVVINQCNTCHNKVGEPFGAKGDYSNHHVHEDLKIRICEKLETWIFLRSFKKRETARDKYL